MLCSEKLNNLHLYISTGVYTEVNTEQQHGAVSGRNLGRRPDVKSTVTVESAVHVDSEGQSNASQEQLTTTAARVIQR